MKERKELTAYEIKPNQEFLCYKIDNRMICPGSRCFIKEIQENCVVIYNKKDPSDIGEKISKNAMFEVELTDEEFSEKYHNASKEVYEILSGPEYLGDRGFHEMYNAWIGRTIEELYVNLKNENSKLIGWFWLPEIKHGLFTDCNIGIIAESEDGERYWCHYVKKSIDYMCKLYKDGR